MSITALIFLSLSLVFLLIYFLLLISFKNKDISLANSFGFEIYSSLPIEKRVLLYFLLFLFSSTSSTGIWMTFSFFNSPYLIFVSSLFLLGYTFIALSNIIPFTLYKYHLISYYSGSAFISVSSLLIFLAKYVEGILIDNDLLPQPFVISLIAISFVLLIFLGNPKNSSWYKLNKVNNNGETKYEKPSINSLALEEWITLALLGLVNSFFIVLSLIL